MTADAAHLLKQLQPAVLPDYASAPRPTPPLDGRGFDELLAEAARGRLDSGRAVSTGFRAADALTDGQLDRLAAAADLAEASGAQQALMVIDGRGFVLDVGSRTLSAELSAGESSRIARVDTAVWVPGEDEQIPGAPVGPPTGVAPPGVAEQIENADRQRPAAA